MLLIGHIQQFGDAIPYPSTITVSGLTGRVSKATVTLNGLSHTYPHDVNVLLVSPAGIQTVLMSHVSDQAADNLDVTLDDWATASLPVAGGLTSISYRPAAYAPTVSFPSRVM